MWIRRSASPRPRDDRSLSPPTRRRRSRSPPPAQAPASVTAPSRLDPEIPLPRVHDVDPIRRRERERQLAAQQLGNDNGDVENRVAVRSEADKQFDAKAEFAKLLGTRAGGAYIPPSRLRAMQAEAAKDKSSPEYQRMSWDALRKSINGLINKVCDNHETPLGSFTNACPLKGQRSKHQARCARAVQRKPNQRTWSLCEINHESSGILSAIHPDLCGSDCNCQYEIANGRRVGSGEVD